MSLSPSALLPPNPFFIRHALKHRNQLIMLICYPDGIDRGEKGSAPYFLFYLRTVDLLTIKGRGFISLLPFILQTAHPTFCGDIAVDTQLPPTYTRLISKRVLSAPGKAWRIQLVEKLIRKSGRF